MVDDLAELLLVALDHAGLSATHFGLSLANQLQDWLGRAGMVLGDDDQRRNSEEAEANAIGTEILRADLLPAAEAPKIRKLLVRDVTAAEIQQVESGLAASLVRLLTGCF